MVKTGIKKFDEIPSTVNFIDVDYLRFLYIKFSSDIERAKKNLKKIQEKLERASEKWERG